MSKYKLIIKDREYSEWEWECIEDQCIEDQCIEKQDNKIIKNNTLLLSPRENKLFHNDIVEQSGSIISQSPYRKNETIHGILITSGKTYGRANVISKHGKQLYKCIPDDKTLPYFLIPYEEKNIGFSKNKKDKYITFCIKEWVDKHPVGTLTNNFGDVDTIENYTAYKMSYLRINDSMQQFNKITLRVLRENSLGTIPFYCDDKPIEDRRKRHIISIDPSECKDIDDAIGSFTIDGETILSVYISNVPMMIEYLKLWDFITNRVSTIYLPDKKIPMLPSILSDNACSLKEGEDRLAFVLDIFINKYTYKIMKVTCNSVIINVKKNYVYENSELLRLDYYNDIKNTVTKVNQCIKNVKYMDKIADSHDVIEYCMLLMNHECAKMLKLGQTGIFRTTTKKEASFICKNTPYPTLNSILKNISGEYCSHDNLKPHYVIAGGLECYTHITSPIRRIVDCAMMLELQKHNFKWSDGATRFLNKWTSPDSIDLINKNTKIIRKLENEIRLIELYNNEKNKNNNVYFGIVFEKTPIETTKGATTPMYKYKIYIQTIKFLSYVITDREFVDYTMVDISVHQFLDEAKMCKKIRLHLV